MLKNVKNLLKSLIIVVVLVILSSIAANAENLVVYSENENAVYMIDEDSVHKFNNHGQDLVIFETMLTLKEGGGVRMFGPKGRNFSTLNIHYAISCTEYKFITLQVDALNYKGTIIAREGRSKSAPIKPGSFMDVSYNNLCRGNIF